MRYRSLLVRTLACAAVLVLSACGTSTGNPQPTSKLPKPTTPSKWGLPRNGAPAVTNPLDVSTLKKDACNALTEKQAKSFAGTFTGNEVEQDGESTYCVWNYEGDRYLLGSISGGLELDDDQGLTRYYKQKSNGTWEVEPVGPIGGYPAVIHDLGMQSIGGCVVAVGVRNDLVYTASTQLGQTHPYRDQPCKVAKQLAGFVIQNLKEAQ